MTSSNEEFVLSSKRNTHSELNGNDVSETSDTVPSVHDNVFFKAFGRSTKHPANHRHDGSEKRNGSAAGMSVDDEIGEYHPGSGFVSKLLGKFSNLSTSSKEENFTPRLKRSSSLEGDAIIEKDLISRKSSTPRESSSKIGIENKQGFSKLTQKAGSIEALNQSHRSRTGFPVSLRHIDRRNNVDKQTKSPRECQVIAPDADLARDDIVIIENTPVPPLVLDDTEEEKEDNGPQISSYRDEVPIEELPKPNTVLNARSIFETASTGSSASTIQLRRPKADSLSEGRNEPSVNKERLRNSYTSNHSPSPVTSPRVLLSREPPNSWRRNSTEAASIPTATVVAEPTANNYTRHSSQDDRNRSTSTSDAPVIKESKPYTSVFDRHSRFDNGKILDSSRPPPSPRSTASVKPTIASKTPSSINVKPIPISTPASVATSFKKSPIVPVAPFKQKEEPVDDGTPVMIYEKPKSPTRKIKPERTNKYDEFRDKPSNEKNGAQQKDFIIPNESKNVFEKENDSNKNKSETISTTYDVSQRRTVENNIANNREKTFSFIKPTVNDVVDENVTKEQKEKDSSVSVGKDKTTISITNNKTKISISNEPEKKVSEKKKYQAPMPEKKEMPKAADRGGSNKLNRAPQAPTNTSVAKPQGMIYVSSSSSEASESDSSPPETPRTEPVKVSQRVKIAERTNISEPPASIEPVVKAPKLIEPVEKSQPKRRPEPVASIEPTDKAQSEKKPESFVLPQSESSDKPIKGIPSIIAQRLNKQTNSPREQSNILAGRSDTDSSISNNDKNSIDSRPLSFRDNLGSMKHAENGGSPQEPSKDVISSEIENEIAAVRKKMDTNRSKGSGPAQIFDSSQLAKKREENKRQRAAAAAAAQGIVPRLDFSSLNDDRSNTGRVMQREIKPCNIKFVGENAKTSRSLLKKQRKSKANVQFNEIISKTFEYPTEDTALDLYLAEHPNEPRELPEEEPVSSKSSNSNSSSSNNGGGGIVFLDGFGGGGGDMGESSDDSGDVRGDSDVSMEPVSPRNRDEENLKSNPALSGTSSTLQSYRGRFQEEFVFGSNFSEPESIPEPVVSQVVDDPDSMMLRPAEDEGSNTWSTNDSSDLLF